MKHCLPKRATLGQTPPVAGEAVKRFLTDSKNHPVSKIIS